MSETDFGPNTERALRDLTSRLDAAISRGDQNATRDVVLELCYTLELQVIPPDETWLS